ncbi:MAG TPA: hypothetical protein VFT99_21995, partial [Roseiflexaceae bacterium]|nr:hypothetical protein [Roseiflexaceae bacterium]
GGGFWGDATWDFAPISPLAVPTMLAGYRTIALLDNVTSAEARILWQHVVLRFLQSGNTSSAAATGHTSGLDSCGIP